MTLPGLTVSNVISMEARSLQQRLFRHRLDQWRPSSDLQRLDSHYTYVRLKGNETNLTLQYALERFFRDRFAITPIHTECLHSGYIRVTLDADQFAQLKLYERQLYNTRYYLAPADAACWTPGVG